MSHREPYSIVFCGLMAAVMAICSWISFPMGEIVFTMQTFAMALILFLLNGKTGSNCIAIYLALGCIGLPVFSRFQGGIGAILGPTGGYILGFEAWGLIYWLFTSLFGRKFHFLAMFTGLIVCYAFGTVWICFFYDYPFYLTLLTCVLPFVVPDCLKIVLAYFLANRLRRFVY